MYMLLFFDFTECMLVTEGRLDVIKDGQKLLTVEPEDMFGELALLYNCTHVCSVSGKHRFDFLVS